MKEKPRDRREGRARGEVPAFTIAPALRCYHHQVEQPRTICGELATHVRRGRWWFDDQYFCEQHALEGDELIRGDRIFRRVRLSVDVLIAGTSLNPSIAQAEALMRLEQAIAAVGGILDVESVRSTFGRYSPTLVPGFGPGGGGVAE